MVADRTLFFTFLKQETPERAFELLPVKTLLLVLKANTNFKVDLTLGRTESIAEQLTRVSHVWEVDSSNPRPDKSYTTLQTISYRLNIYAMAG